MYYKSFGEILEEERRSKEYGYGIFEKEEKVIRCRIPELFEIYGTERITNNKTSVYSNHKVLECSHYEWTEEEE